MSKACVCNHAKSDHTDGVGFCQKCGCDHYAAEKPPLLPRQHIYSPRMDAKTRKHFAKWTRDELIAHVLSYQDGLYAANYTVSSDRTREAHAKQASMTPEDPRLLASATYMHHAHVSRLGLFARCIALESSLRRQTTERNADAASRTYEAQEGLGLSLLTSNAELALQDLEFAAARVRSYLKRIKEKL